MRLLVGVCAFRRPRQLQRLLDSLAAVSLPVGWTVDLVIVDNDPDGSSVEVASSARPVGAGAGEVAVLPLGASNISVARNAVLQRADDGDHDAVAFVDDDEWVEPDWLVQLVGVLERHGADVAVGPVIGVLPQGAPAWMAPYFAVLHGEDGAALYEGITGNVLFLTSAVRAASLRFDLDLGRSGGEDQVFFRTLHRAGASLRSAAHAVAYEDVPVERARVGYLLRRSFRIGNTLGLIDAHLLPQGRSRWVRMAKALVWGGRGTVRTVVGAPVAWSPRWRGVAVRGATEIARALGMLAGVRGMRHQFYVTSPGSRTDRASGGASA